MPGDGELLAAAHLAGFDEHDISANRRPDKAHRNAGFLHALLDFLLDANFLETESLANHFGRHDLLFRLALGNAPRLLANERCDFTFEVSHACFPRVAVNQVVQRLVGEFNLFAQRQTVFLGLPGNQKALRDVDLFLFGVTREFDDLHAIAQRFRNWIHPVRSRHPENLRKVEGHVQIVIAEGGVLFRVEHFHQRRRRITAEIATELVNFVQHKNRIQRFSSANSLNDLAGKRANVSAAMSANFRFVVHAAERDADELASHRSRD